jgi:hypothetical protein
VPSPRSAKEICAEDPKGISCKVATRREQRRKNRDEAYGLTPAPKPPPKKPAAKKPTKPATQRRKYLEEKILEGQGLNES